MIIVPQMILIKFWLSTKNLPLPSANNLLQGILNDFRLVDQCFFFQRVVERSRKRAPFDSGSPGEQFSVSILNVEIPKVENSKVNFFKIDSGQEFVKKNFPFFGYSFNQFFSHRNTLDCEMSVMIFI